MQIPSSNALFSTLLTRTPTNIGNWMIKANPPNRSFRPDVRRSSSHRYRNLGSARVRRTEYGWYSMKGKGYLPKCSNTITQRSLMLFASRWISGECFQIRRNGKSHQRQPDYFSTGYSIHLSESALSFAK